MWTISDPSYLLLLLTIIPGVYFIHFRPRRGGVISYPLGIWQGERFSGPSRRLKVLLYFTSMLFWAGFAVLIVALAGPVKVEKEQVYLNRGMDILFVLDESPSMSAKDFPPVNRFETAKALMADFVSNRENDAVGLVTFSGEAALRIPPTVDYDAFKGRLDPLAIMTLGEGTSIGLGLAIGILHLQDSSAGKQVMILLTDGENNGGEIGPVAASRIAAEMGIKVYTVGLGSEGVVFAEYTDPDSGTTYRGPYQSGYNEELLMEIASITGGRYFHAPSPGALQQVLGSIDSLESEEKRILIRAHSVPGHRPVILIGFLLIMISFLIRKALLREVL